MDVVLIKNRRTVVYICGNTCLCHQFNEIERGYTGFTLSVCYLLYVWDPFGLFDRVCRSVRFSVRLWTKSCLLCILHNTSRIHFIFMHLNNQLQRVCRVLIFWWICLHHGCVHHALTLSGCEVTLHWRHNDHDGVSNHQPHDYLLNRLFRRRSKKTSKLRVTGLCVGNSPGTGEFPAQNGQ